MNKNFLLLLFWEILRSFQHCNRWDCLVLTLDININKQGVGASAIPLGTPALSLCYLKPCWVRIYSWKISFYSFSLECTVWENIAVNEYVYCLYAKIKVLYYEPQSQKLSCSHTIHHIWHCLTFFLCEILWL